jgi:hypothetical protein
MPGVLVRCACTNNAKFAFQHDKPDVSVKEFTKILLAQYENYRKRLGQKGPRPDVIHLVDECGCAVLDDVDMSVYLSASAATFGLVLRDDMERLALQHDAHVKDVLENLCFDRDKTCFSFSYGIFKRPDTKKRASPELSDAPTESRKDNKRNKGPVKEMVRDIINKGLCLESDIPEHGRERLFKLPHDAGLKMLEAFKELMSKNKGAEKKQLFMQSLEPFSPSNTTAKGSASPTKPLAITDGAEETAAGKKRKQDEQEAKKATPVAAETAKSSSKKPKTADAADKLQLAASGKTLSVPATPAGSKEASSDDKDKKAAAKKEDEMKKKKEEERLAKEKEKEEKERLKKEKAAKEKEEKERLKQEKAEKVAKEKEEKERLKKEKAEKAAKEKEDKERQKKEKEEKERQETERKKIEEEAAKAKAKEEKKAAAAAKAKELAAAAAAAAAAAEKAARDAEASEADEEEGEEDKQKKGIAKPAAADSENEAESGGEETEEESSSDEDEKEEKPRAEPAKKAAAAERASEPSKKDEAVKVKSLQEEKAKLEAQLRLKKSPAATPASKAGTAGAPGKALAFAGDKWHADVKVQMTMLEKTGKLKEADLDQGALKALKTLPYEVALVCLNKIANETSAIRNMNAFIVKNCTHLRNQWGVDDAASSSSDDDSSDDDESEEEEEEEAPKAKSKAPAASKAAPKVVDVKPVADSDSEDDEDATEASGGKSEDAGDTDSDASDEEQADPLKALVASGSKGKSSPVAIRVRNRTRT